MAAKTQYDWTQIETEYVTGDKSLRELRIMHGCGERTIFERSAAGEWDNKRQQFRSTLKAAKVDGEQARLIFDKLQFDALTEHCTDLAVALMERELVARMECRGGIDAQEMNQAMGALGKAQEVKYRSLGIPLRQAIDISQTDSASPADSIAALVQAEVAKSGIVIQPEGARA